MRVARKYFCIFFMFFTFYMIFPAAIIAAESPNVFIDNRSSDIYESGGSGSVTFDKNSNVLTLNNYNGNKIEFLNFPENSNITINVYGDNEINSDIEFNFLTGTDNGISADSVVNFIFVGHDNSNLSINDFYNGIYLDTGNITLEKLNLDIDDAFYCGVYSTLGDLYIKNSDLFVKNADYAVATDSGSLFVQDSDIDIDNSYYGLYAYYGDTLISNSNINIDGFYRDYDYFYYGIYAYYGDIKINNKSDIYIKDSYYGVVNDTGDIYIDDSDLTIIDASSSSGCSMYNYGDIFINGNIDFTATNSSYALVWTDGLLKIDGGNININSNYGGIYADSLEVNGGNTIINSSSYGVELVGESSYFNNGDFYVNSILDMAFYIPYYSSGEVNHFVLSDNVGTLESGLSLKKSVADGYTYYSIGDDSVLDEYSSFDLLNSAMAKKVSISSGNKIIFDSNGGTGSMSNIYFNGQVTLPDNGFIAPNGMRFGGWSLSSDGELIDSVNVDRIVTVYAIWVSDIDYEFSDGCNIDYIIGKNNHYSIRIDKDFSLFNNLEISSLDLVNGIDYIVTEGSTIISFTESGINKLNSLALGNYSIIAKYNDGSQISGILKISNINIDNPKTLDCIYNYVGLCLLSMFGICVSYVRKYD